ncbi:MAG: hypothetical protein FWG85_05280 [Bacteroidetes bacterium]|nr:hypothetical protein [Bacteroidota bacterium]
MKKTSFFYVLIVGLIINFNSCKDPVTHPDPPKSTGLESKSFIVEELKDSVAGHYADYIKSETETENSLKCSYSVRNKTNNTINYNVSIERVQAEPLHIIIHCILVCIAPTNMSNFFGLTGVWEPGFSGSFLPEGKTYPATDSYIQMWSGEGFMAGPGLNKLKVTYTNENDPSDYVYFTLTFNFFE